MSKKLIKKKDGSTYGDNIGKLTEILATGEEYSVRELSEIMGCTKVGVHYAINAIMQKNQVPLAIRTAVDPKIKKPVRLYYDPLERKKLLDQVARELRQDPRVVNKKYTRRHSSEYPMQNIKIKTKGNVATLVPIGDLHWGSNECDVDMAVSAFTNLGKAKDTWVALMGDMTEFALKSSPGASMHSQMVSPHLQTKQVIDMLLPVADKTIVYVEGNHEERSFKEGGSRVSEQISSLIDIPLYTASCYTFLDVDFNGTKQRFKIFFAHGRTGATTTGGKINAAMKPAQWTSFDVCVTGHSHDLQCVCDIEHEWIYNPLGINIKKRHFVISGSFLRWFGSYAEPKLLKPAAMGFPIIRFHKNGEIKVET